jgi:hypothetical protein
VHAAWLAQVSDAADGLVARQVPKQDGGSTSARAPWRRMILDPRLGAHVLCFELNDEPSETRWERRREWRPVSHEAALGCCGSRFPLVLGC